MTNCGNGWSGAISHDVTDKVHKSICDKILEVTNFLEIDVAGLDVRCIDIQKPVEEAHRYISTETGKVFGDANRIFERIAKEGRKYGMFLLVSSQRPSELSKTVLSQCSNFIVHRIQNPEDLSHIRQITPHISETVLKRLPSIPTQHALIFGHSVNLPTTFKVNNANPKPKSDNNEISKNWFRNKGFEVDFI